MGSPRRQCTNWEMQTVRRRILKTLFQEHFAQNAHLSFFKSIFSVIPASTFSSLSNTLVLSSRIVSKPQRILMHSRTALMMDFCLNDVKQWAQSHSVNCHSLAQDYSAIYWISMQLFKQMRFGEIQPTVIYYTEVMSWASLLSVFYQHFNVNGITFICNEWNDNVDMIDNGWLIDEFVHHHSPTCKEIRKRENE